MTCFADLPSEVVDSVLENLDQESLSSTAIVASPLQYPSERLMYRTARFRLLSGQSSERRLVPTQGAFLRTVSRSERRAGHVTLLSLQKIEYEDEERDRRLHELERAMRLMVNLKKLSIIGMEYIRRAHLESSTFKLVHLALHAACPPFLPYPSEILLPILKAHPGLRSLSLPGVWDLTKADALALEEQKSESGGQNPHAVVCPGLEYIESHGEEVLQTLLVGRRVKHMILDRGTEEAGRKWGSPSMLPTYRHLKSLVLYDSADTISDNLLPFPMARALISLTRLNVVTNAAVYGRPAMRSYTPNTLILSIVQIRTLESLTLSSDPRWSTSILEENDLVRYIYKSCPNLKEAFVQRSPGSRQSHAHYGAGGKLVGVVGRHESTKMDLDSTRLFLRIQYSDS